MLHIIVLGSAAGGGFPQWNSNAAGCRAARQGRIAARTQTSLAVSADARDWYILNASPDIRAQILATSELQAHEGVRSTPIQAVILTNGEVDAIAGLLTLREREAFSVYATPTTLAQLDANPIFEVLDRSLVTRLPLKDAQKIALPLKTGAASGLTLTAFDVPGKAPLYADPPVSSAASTLQRFGNRLPETPSSGETIGLEVSDGRTKLVFLPACAALTPPVLDRLRHADCLFIEATLWRDDEMIRVGLSHKTGLDMGHLSLSGPDGLLKILSDLPAQRLRHRVLIHINNSNPILIPGSEERQITEAAGWTIAEDGLRFTVEALT